MQVAVQWVLYVSMQDKILPCTDSMWHWICLSSQHLFEAHRQNVLHGDYENVVCDQEVPVVQDLFDWLQQQLATKEQEVEARHQVAHTEDAYPCCARDEDDGEDEPEEVAEHNDLQHVQVGPEGQG